MAKRLFVLGAVILLVVIFLGCGVRWQIKDTWVYVYGESVQGVTVPLPGALVSLSGEQYTGIKYTNGEGKVLFQIPPGTYLIQVSKSGYTTVTETITIYTLELTPGRYYYVLQPQT
ncbi:MAG: PEGA domain-containing protein [Candidatus Caldatribacteriaceae bacterium]